MKIIKELYKELEDYKQSSVLKTVNKAVNKAVSVKDFPGIREVYNTSLHCALFGWFNEIKQKLNSFGKEGFKSCKFTLNEIYTIETFFKDNGISESLFEK